MEQFNNASLLQEHFDTPTLLDNSTCAVVDNVIYWALNCYGVTISALLTNLVVTCIGISIVLLNATATVVILQRKSIENASDFLIASLALADTVVGLFLVYHSAYNLGNWQIFSECLFRYGILLGVDLTSAFHLSLLTADRYVKITRPYLYQRIFNRNAVIAMSVILWAVALMLGFLPVFGWNNGAPPVTEPQCGFYFVLTRGYTLLLVILFLVPLAVNIALYGHVFRIANRHARSIAQQSSVGNGNVRTSSRSWKFTKTVCILMGFYFCCWMPIGVFLLLDLCGYLRELGPEDKGGIIMYLSTLAYINSLVNPIIYAVKIPYIKQSFKRIYTRLCCCYRDKSEVQPFDTTRRMETSFGK